MILMFGVLILIDDLSLLSLRVTNLISIIHLVRDIRSWLPGRIKASRREGLPFSRIRGAARWIHVNNKFSRVFNASSLHLRMGYEEFYYPELCLRMVCKWIGVPFCDNMLSRALIISRMFFSVIR